MKYFHFIINPVSGGGKHNLTESAIRNHFPRSQFKVEVNYSRHKGHTIDLAAQIASKKPDCVIACGGDGTINEVASSLIETGIALGIVPIGSGNGLASHLKIPREVEDAFAVIRNGNVSSIDAGKVNECYFFSNMGVGIDAQIIKRYERSGKRKLMAYIMAALSASLSFKPKKMTVATNRELRRVKPYMLFISNSNEMGYSMSLTPDASLADGHLDLFIVDEIPLWKQVELGIKVLRKRIGEFKPSHRSLVTNVKIEVADAKVIDTQLDGEFKRFTTDILSVSIVGKGLKVLVPQQV